MNQETELIFQTVFNQFFQKYPEPLANSEKQKIQDAISDLNFKLTELGNLHRRTISQTQVDNHNRIWTYKEEEEYIVDITDEELATLLLYAFLTSNKQILEEIFELTNANEEYIKTWLKKAHCKYRHKLFNYREYFS